MADDSSTRPERRRHPRSVVGIPVEAVRRDLPPRDPNRVVGLHVTDLSPSGAGAVVYRPLPTEEPVTLFFPPMGSAEARDTRGRVVRCEGRRDHWQVGIAFEDPLPDVERIPAT
ncbi:MAG: PilZ domain-containing protein [Phycisphaerae bacterium]